MNSNSQDKMATKVTGVDWYIGDLSYVTTDKEWSELYNLFLVEEGPELTFSDGRKVFMMNTLYGDGQYFDGQNREYYVDSGTLGAMRISDITAHAKLQNVKEMELGVITALEYDLTVENVTEDEGNLIFGNVVVVTGDALEYKPVNVVEGED
jgi:hypothetical protein